MLNAKMAREINSISYSFLGFREYIYKSIEAAAFKGECGVMVTIPEKFANDYRFELLTDELSNHGFTVCEEKSLAGVTVSCYSIYWSE